MNKETDVSSAIGLKIVLVNIATTGCRIIPDFLLMLYGEPCGVDKCVIPHITEPMQ